jgi:hypothetical protein
MPFYSLSSSGGLVEAATYAALPATGATGTLYVVTATNTLYRWSGSAYVEVSASITEIVEGANLAAFPATGAAGKIYVALDTGKAYRWGGSSYTEISAGDWATISNKPSTFAPSAHATSHASGGSDAVTLAVSQVTGLQTALDGKAAASHTHAASAITSGTIDAARLPATSVQSAASGEVLLNTTIPAGADPSDYLPFQVRKNNSPVFYVASNGDGFLSGNLQLGGQVACTTFSGSINANSVNSGILSPARIPAATTSALGGVIVGTGLSVSSGTLSANVGSVAGRTGTVTLAHSDIGNSPSTLTQFTASQNNLSLGSGGIIRISSSAAVNVTGFAATSAGDARLLSNVGTFAITLKHSDSASTANNRILCIGNADVQIEAGGSAVVYYDGTDSRWRVG